MSAENRLSDERLASLLDQLGDLRPGPVRMAPNDVPDLLAALDELQSLRAKPVAGVSVKPLVWKRRTEGGVWRAETLIGEYRVWTHHEADGAWFWNLTGGATTKSDKCLSEDAAKAAAETDYRQRILSVLSVADQEPVAWLSPCISGPYKGQFEVENAKPDRPPFNQMWGDWFPVYASPQPEVVITEDMVERVMSWLREDVLPAYGITHNNRASDPEMIEGCRAALTAALKES